MQAMLPDPNLGKRYEIARSGPQRDGAFAEVAGDLNVYEANRRHDQEHGNARRWTRIRSAWNLEMLVRLGILTDKRIEQLREQGRYTDAYKAAIKALIAEKNKKLRDE